MRRNLYFWIVTVSVLLLFSFAIDLTPYLRGPAPYPPDWRWPYELSLNLNKIWAPILVFITILVVFKKTVTINMNDKTKTRFYLLFLVLLGFLLHVSILYYGRAGIEVLIHRTINPMISGYFTAALNFPEFLEFIREFNSNISEYPMYARFHPPGGILFYHAITLGSGPFVGYFQNLLNQSPNHADVALIWRGLSDAEKFNALGSGIITIFLANLAVIPLFFVSKLLYGTKAAYRATAIYPLIPSVLLFYPLIDSFLPLFTVTSLYFFIRALKMESKASMFFSGFILFLGLFFSLTFIPVILFFIILYVDTLWKKRKLSIINFKPAILFFTGLILPIGLLAIAGLNFVEMTLKIMQFHELAQSGRGYVIWLFYNLYDFLIFMGIPVGILTLVMFYKNTHPMKKIKNYKKVDPIFIAFSIMLLSLLITGAVRAETGRIWLPFVPLLLLPVVNFITKELKWSSRQFLGLVIVMFLNAIIFQTVLVTVW